MLEKGLKGHLGFIFSKSGNAIKSKSPSLFFIITFYFISIGFCLIYAEIEKTLKAENISLDILKQLLTDCLILQNSLSLQEDPYFIYENAFIDIDHIRDLVLTIEAYYNLAIYAEIDTRDFSDEEIVICLLNHYQLKLALKFCKRKTHSFDMILEFLIYSFYDLYEDSKIPKLLIVMIEDWTEKNLPVSPQTIWKMFEEISSHAHSDISAYNQALSIIMKNKLDHYLFNNFHAKYKSI